MKNAMIWGASGGIGSAILASLKEDGWRTIAIRRNSLGENIQADLEIEADVKSSSEVQMAVMQVAQEFDQIDLWVYAIGDIISSKVGEMEPDEWARILTSNLTGAYLTTHYSLPLLSENAHLFYLGALTERMRLPGLSAYAAAKAGLEAFAEALTKEQRRQRITVVRPAAVETALWEKVPMRLPKDAPKPEKIARLILDAYQNQHKGLLDLA